MVWAGARSCFGSSEEWDKDPAYLTFHVNPNSPYQHLIADTEIFGHPLNLAHCCDLELVRGT
jgi:hypothetical protein